MINHISMIIYNKINIQNIINNEIQSNSWSLRIIFISLIKSPKTIDNKVVLATGLRGNGILIILCKARAHKLQLVSE